ncbi:PilZ domain-containing protein [Sphingomonas canadensis]|uniref:PilZ domain-containing protein n=1 Tax=Sphingomonas canadensis TaxID=1219257 RepID=A0ABW3H9D3_9SPHN|nr:PilZ domain-containing protein [Sphingomonas canadensis]MCW3837759.1 PilZ domain-containing protein [Sphingomonas canadensis]
MSADPPVLVPLGGGAGSDSLESAILAGPEDRIQVAIRRLSAVGATLSVDPETVEALVPGEPWVLELRNGQRIEGTLAWATEGEAGFAFVHPVDVVGTLARNLAILPAERRRVPRIELRHTVGIRCGREFELARTRNLSQAGVGIETALDLAPDDAVQIALDGLPTLSGHVRWMQDGHAGIAFDAEVAWQVLMPWLRHAQHSPTQGSPGAPRRALHDELRGFLATHKDAVRVEAPARVRRGANWWNVRVRSLTPQLVEFDASAHFEKGTPLWIALPRIAGWPATVVEGEDGTYLAEFRLPLREQDFAIFAPQRKALR